MRVAGVSDDATNGTEVVTSTFGSARHDATPPPLTIEAGAVTDFDVFYEQGYDRLVRALAVTLSDADLGREAADEAMVRAYQRWEHIGRYDNPGGWTYRVGLNWARSLHRRLSRRLPLQPERHADPPSIPDPAIALALDRLGRGQREVVVCRLLLDWSVEDTGTALRLRPGTVKSRLHRALKTLETELEHLR